MRKFIRSIARKTGRRLSRTRLYFWLCDFWRNLGQVNQVLLVLGVFFTVSLSLTTGVIASRHYELRSIKCLALNIYHEARGEPLSGQYAVATVSMNRVNSDRYPDDVCRVVYQKGWSRKHQRYISAFSWTSFTHEKDVIPKEDKAWRQAFNIAKNVYQDNKRSDKTRNALFYHADYVKPKWAAQKTKITKIGRHIFYQ
jgi:spore germination cell wall hydrolase CwlJ-like protein